MLELEKSAVVHYVTLIGNATATSGWQNLNLKLKFVSELSAAKATTPRAVFCINGHFHCLMVSFQLSVAWQHLPMQFCFGHDGSGRASKGVSQ
jgi:hypothetical protein